MKNTLLSLLTTVAFVAPTFASASAESNQLTASTPQTHSASIIIETTKKALKHGAPVPNFQYNRDTKKFFGDPLTFEIEGIEGSGIKIQSDPLGIYISKGSGSEDTVCSLPQPCSANEFSKKLFEAMSFVVSKLKLNPCDLIKLHLITIKVFYPNPNILHVCSQKILSYLLKRYHLPTLEFEISDRISDLTTDSETLSFIARQTYERNIVSPKCPEQIKSAFLQISETLMRGADYCQAHDLPPTKCFQFLPAVATFTTILFELDDKVDEYQTIKILGSDHEVTGLPMLSPQQIDFVTRWVNYVLSPFITRINAFVREDGRDGLPLLPETLTRPENLWEQYSERVFGKTESVIFARKPASVTPSS